MVLYEKYRKPHLFCRRSCIIRRMHIAGNNLRLGFQQFFHSFHRLF